MASEREITEEVDLCRPDGRLDGTCVGWSRRPLHRPNLRGWGRTKRWEYWGIVTPSHIVGVTVSSLDYAGVESLYLLDRATGEETVHEAVVPFARGVVLPDRCGAGSAHADAQGLVIDLDDVPGGTRIRARTTAVDIDVLATRPAGHECLAVVVPWSPTRFQYTVKDVGRPASGLISVGAVSHLVTPDASYAVLDHGRGRWPYSIRWNWGAASGTVDGVTVGLQVGGRWTDGTGSTENALFVDGVAHKISEDLRWHYDRVSWTYPWRINGPRIDVTLRPFHVRSARTNLLVVASETHQVFGTYEGWACATDGTRVSVDGLVGWAEESRNRW